ncbi:hypothetical protein YYE_04986 [Plasmodium vinckei vinckei]|uniref:CIR protein PIR protein n=1 Tax=Plasmodium vinckei vinckei TaxID=54757 RepID=A0A081I908_PLAVN|nr:hypothetical protein YYE_04986 [Plasmodium vinckei vinckei]
MAESSYNIEDLYKEINTIDGYFGVTKQAGGGTDEEYKQEIHKYCHYGSSSGNGNCGDYFQSASSGVIYLLTNLKEKHNLEYDKLAEYAILWLRYKLNLNTQSSSIKLNDFYTQYIETNNDYNKNLKDSDNMTYKDIIVTNKDLMNIIEISKFNGLFSILFSFYNGIKNSNLDCKNCSTKANEFVNNFKELNEDSNINGNTSYIKLLSTLSNDYDHFKSYCAEKYNDCNDFPTLPKIKTPPSKLLPVLSIFSVIPVFLGISYKYKEFVTINSYFEEEKKQNGEISLKSQESIHDYCHYENDSGKGNCCDYFQMTSSGVIYLLKNLKEKCNLDYDKLAEYAILWLIYKLNIKENNTVIKNDFYDKYIETNKDYNKKIKDDNLTYKGIINRKKDLMDMNINEIFKLEAPFNILYYLYYVIRVDDCNCTNDSNYANKFVQNFEALNNDSNNIKDSPFSQILSTLSNDYKNFIKIYHNKDKSCDFPPLLDLNPKKISVEKSGKDGEQISLQPPEGTSSSSSILNTIIPGLSTFAIPAFLGIAYKVNNKELTTITFKLYFCDSLYAFIKKYIIIFPFLY